MARLLRPFPMSRVHLIAIEGAGGVGKTTLAMEVAYSYVSDAPNPSKREGFDAIVWVSAKDSILSPMQCLPRQHCFHTLDDLYLAIATVLEEERILTTGQPERYNLIIRALTKRRVLLIVDNLETVRDDAVLPFLRELPLPTKVIVTSRHRIDFAYSIQLEGMALGESKIIMANECARLGKTLTETQMQRLHDLTAGVPLAVVWSVAQVARGYDADSVFRKLDHASDEIALFCCGEAINSIRNSAAYYLLLATSRFVDTPSQAAIRYVCNLADEELEDAWVLLQHLSLITRHENDRISILPLTRHMANMELDKNNQELRDIYKDRFLKFYTTLVPNLLGSDFWSSLAQWRNYDQIDSEFSNIRRAVDICYLDGKWDSLLLLTTPLVHYLYTRALFEERFRQAMLSIQACEATCQHELEAYMRIGGMGWLHMRRGELKDARDQIRLGLAVAQKVSFSDGIVLAHAHLAAIALTENRVEEAESMLAVVQGEQPTAQVRARLLFARGQLQARRWNWAQAEIDLREAVNQLSECSDYFWPALHIALGNVLLSQDKLDEAQEVLERALAFSIEMRRKTEVGNSWYELARLALKRRNRKLAHEYALKALVLLERYDNSTEVGQVTHLIRETEPPWKRLTRHPA